MRSWVATALVGLAAAGCATAPALDPLEQPRLGAVRASTAREPVALVLSGGSARGFAHIGVIKVLQESGLRPDIVVGSSAGALVGALYASGLSADEIERKLAGVDGPAFADMVWPRLGALPGALGFVSGNHLRRLVAERLPIARLEDFPTTFAAVATDVDAGSPALFNLGDAATAVQASMAVPLLFAPVAIGPRRFVDGQVSSPIPVQAARQLGASHIIAVDVVYPPEDSALTSPMRVLFQAFLISTYRLREMQVREAELVITPAIAPTTGQYGLAQARELVAAGEAAAREALPRLRRIMAPR